MSRIVIAGIDPGSIVTGYGLLEINEKNHILALEYGVIKTDTKKKMAKRLEQIFDDLSAIFLEYKPNFVITEKAFVGKNVYSALVLAQVRGIIMLASQKSNAELSEKAATSIKKAVTGNGRASKSQLAYITNTTLGINDVNMAEDSSDALSMALSLALKLKGTLK